MEKEVKIKTPYGVKNWSYIKRLMDQDVAQQASSDAPMTTGDVAKKVQVHLRTVLQWIEEGYLKAYRTPGRHCRIKRADFVEFVTTFKLPSTMLEN